MAGLLIYGATYLVVKGLDTVKIRRSPIVPTPPRSDPTAVFHYSGDSDLGIGLLVTEVEAVSILEVPRRYALVQKGLEYAIAHGWDVCWAGRTSESLTVRRARSESRFVVDQLALAIAWCRSQQVPKTSFVSTLEPRSKIRRQARAAHYTCPPSLLELPWPIPEPPREREYGLVIERAPRFTREGPEALPLYSPAVDQERGEQSLKFTPLAEGERRA